MKKSIANDALKLTISKVITIVISMATVMLLARFRTLNEYGTYSQILLVVNLTTSIFMLGLPNSINFFLARAENDDERQKFLSIYYTLSTALSFVTGLILVLSTPFIVSYFKNPYIEKFFYVLAVYPWTKIIQSGIDHICIVYNKTKLLVVFRLLHSLCLLIIVVIVEVLGMGFSMFMFLFILVEAFFALSIYFITRILISTFKIQLDKDLIKNIFRFSVPIGLATVIGTLSIEMDKLLIGRFFDTEQLAIYAIAAREMPVTIIASSLTAVLMPQMVWLLKKNENDQAITLWGNATLLSYLFICFFATGLFVFAPEIISLLYSDKYLPGVEVFRIYSIVLLLRCTYFGMVLNSIGKTKFIFYSSLASLGLNIILNYTLYLAFGFIGPAIATLITIAVVQVCQLVVTSRAVNISFENLFPWRGLAIITTINIFMGTVFAILKGTISLQFVTGEIIESIILGVLWAIVYIFIMSKFIKQKWSVLNENRN